MRLQPRHRLDTKRPLWVRKLPFTFFWSKMGHFRGHTTARRWDLLRKQLRLKLVYVPNYQNTKGENILEKYCFFHFFRHVEFFFKILFFRKNPNLSDTSCGYAGGSPPGRGVENARQDPGYRF